MKFKYSIRKGTICLFIFFLAACSKDQEIKPLDSPKILHNEEEIQMANIVGILSGKDTIEYGYYLPSRAAEIDKVKVRTYLKGLINLLSLVPLEHNYIAGNGGTNIFASLPATINTTEYIIVGAHYDSVFGSPGANDNATGVAMIFGMIKNLKKVAIRNKNIMFVFFDDEEMGLIGSSEFAIKIISDSLNVHSVHTVDQMGWDSDGDRAIELELPTDSLKAKYEAAALESNIPVFITNTGSTDHSSFRSRGFDAIGLTEEYRNGDTSPYYHRAGDTYATVNFEYLFSSTNLMSKVITKIVSE